MNKDGTENKQLTFDSGRNSLPTVSRDGRYIIYVSNRMGTRNIWRMDIDGGNKKQLTHGSDDVSPQFTPDNQWVIYTSAEIDTSDIMESADRWGQSCEVNRLLFTTVSALA